MWTCNRCGRDHETLFDARSCACRADPQAVRRHNARRVRALLCGLLALGMGAGIGALWGFKLRLVTVADGFLLGSLVGLVIGIFWGMWVALSPPAPPKPDA
jgi:hypothetical protein